MKFKINRDEFSDVLFKIQGVCAQKSTLPILASCLIEAQEDGRISVRGTDLEVSISTSCKAEVKEVGQVAITARRLFDTVKSVSAAELVLSTEPNYWTVLDADRVHARIAGSHPEEFPQLSAVDDDLPVSMPAEDLLDMIEKTFFSISTDEARASFTGCFFRLTEQKTLQMVSTDGHRLSKIEIPIKDVDLEKVTDALAKGVIVPRKGLAELKRVLIADSIVRFGVKGDDLLVANENTQVTLRLIPGRFPNFEQVIPKALEHNVTISRESILAALKRAAFYTAKTGNTRITLSDSTLEIYAFDPEAGELSEPIPCDYSGPGASAGFNYKYLLDVVNVVEGDEFTFEMIDTESPTVIRDLARDDVLYIVMPMQI